ncbi:hypothetical protein ACO2Q8_03190 [Larkinella sp. VNQ87]|uniref:hypothetical protein n=1 Tax=Larkinella sp. VNQ87 TaxID=3400921 RepID=UPI003C0F6D1E
MWEIIVVTPNANTRYFATFYFNSVTTSNWADSGATERVSHIDSQKQPLHQPDAECIPKKVLSFFPEYLSFKPLKRR